MVDLQGSCAVFIKKETVAERTEGYLYNAKYFLCLTDVGKIEGQLGNLKLSNCGRFFVFTIIIVLLQVFSVTPFKIEQNKNQKRSIDPVQNRGKEKAKYAKSLAKIQVSALFLKQGMRRISFTRIYRDLYGDATLPGADPDGHRHDGGKPIETSVAQFGYKSVDLSPEELKNIKIILLLIHELFRQLNSPK